MSAAGARRCTVAYATPAREFLWHVALPPAATVADAIAAARAAAGGEGGIPWESAAVGIYGEIRARTDAVADGDRIELYRPLAADPRERRRARVQRERGRRG